MATAMILFNLLLFIALRDVIYLLYVSFVSCIALGIASQNGFVQRIFMVKYNSVVGYITVYLRLTRLGGMVAFHAANVEHSDSHSET